MDDLQVRRGSHSPREQTSLSHHQTGHISAGVDDADSSGTPTKQVGPNGKLRRTFSDLGLSGSNILGQRLSVFWEGTDLGDVWYDGRVVEYNHAKKEYLVEYDDGDTDWYDLDKVKYTILPPESGRSNGNNELVTKEDESNMIIADVTKRRKTFSSLGMSGVSILGRTLEIYWSDPDSGDAWYKGVLKEYRISDGKHFIVFEDGDSDWYDLDDIKYRLPDDNDDNGGNDDATTTTATEGDHHEHHTAQGHTSTWTKDDVAEQKRTINEQNLKGEEAIGATIEIFWQDDDAEGGGMWYAGNIDEFNGTLHHVTYEDGDSDWYDLNSIKHHVLEMPLNKSKNMEKKKKKKKIKKKEKMEFSSSQPDESRLRSQEWLENLKKRRAEKNDQNKLGYDVVGELSVGGVVALRVVHEAMLKDRYFLKSAQERLDEYWNLQLRARFGGNKKLFDVASEERSRSIKTLRTELSTTKYLLPPSNTKDTSSSLHDRFHEIARAHGDLHVAGLPGQVLDGDDELDGDDGDGGDHAHHTNQVLGLQSESRRAGLSSHAKVPKRIVIQEDSSTKEEQEKMESELLAGAIVPPPPAPQVQVTLDALLESMKVGELGEGEKHPEDYVHEFLEAVPEKEIVVGGISLRDVQLQERKIEMERLDTMRREVLRYRRREEALMVQEERARVRVLQEADGRRKKLDETHHDNVRRIRRLERSMRRGFIRKEDQLRQNLEEQHAIVSNKIGTLERRQNTDELSYSVFSVHWDRVPQPIALDVRLMRAVRDRLPNGRYVFLVTLYDRVGGSPLFWTEAGLNGSSVGLPGATDPIRHKGRYYDVDTHVHKTAYTVCPAKRDVKPTLTYVLEVFQLGTGKWPDRVVAWTVLPAVDIACNYTVGKFRLPLLRGPVDPELDLYSRFEEAYTSDLDRWLCNVYVEIRLESKETLTGDGTTMLRNQEIVSDFTSRLLQVKKGEYLSRDEEEEQERDEDGRMREGEVEDQGVAHTLVKGAATKMNKKKTAPTDFGGYKPPEIQKAMKRQRTAVRLGTPSTSTDATTRNISDDLNVGLSDFQKGEAMAKKTDLQSLSKYGAAVMRRGAPSFTNASEAARRLVFLYYEIMDEYRIRRWATIDFWVSFMILVVGFYVRLYLHYLGLYLYLKIIGVQNVSFGDPTVEPFQVLTKYQKNLAVHQELGAAISGQVFNICIFACFMAINYGWKNIFGRLPDIMSKWTMGFGTLCFVV